MSPTLARNVVGSAAATSPKFAKRVPINFDCDATTLTNSDHSRASRSRASMIPTVSPRRARGVTSFHVSTSPTRFGSSSLGVQVSARSTPRSTWSKSASRVMPVLPVVSTLIVATSFCGERPHPSRLSLLGRDLTERGEQVAVRRRERPRRSPVFPADNARRADANHASDVPQGCTRREPDRLPLDRRGSAAAGAGLPTARSIPPYASSPPLQRS